MTTAEFIIALFYRIDNQMHSVPKHPQAALYPSEVVTLGVLYALKGGGKPCLIVNQWGLIVDWDWDTANGHDSVLQPMIRRVEDQMIVWSDQGFHAQAGDPTNLKVCAPKTGGERMGLETVFSMLTRISRFKHHTHRAWAYFNAHLSLVVATFNRLVQWHGLQPDENGFVKVSIAEFSR
jgi:hypothetical protein